MKFDWTLEAENNIHTVGHEDWKGGELHVSTDLASAKLTKVVGTMDLAINPDEKIFMNGYQTWTVCPEMTKDDRIRGMHKIPKKLLDQYGFDRYGDYHFYDYPYERGVSHGYSWCYFRNGKNFRLFASLNEEPGYTMFRYDAKLGILTIERDCAGLVVNGNYQLFDLFFAEGSEQEVFDAWFKVLDLKRKTTDKIYGYSSWYNRYQDINETAIEQDLAGCRSILKPNDLFQVDDGWETFVGDWIGADQSKFPAGMKKIADEIHSAGFRAGLWLAPFVAEEKSELYQKHQDWFLKVNHANWWLGSNWSGFYALDIDKPEVQEYLRQVFHQVFDEWGYDLVKLDFVYGAAPFGNEKETRAGRMIRAMKFLRELCGDHLILGCGVPVMPAFGYVDYCRISCDVSLDWDDVWYMKMFLRERVSTKNAITNILSRRELNGRAYLSDPDVFFLRENNIKLTDQEKMDLATLDALLGGVFLTSDDPGTYTDAMKQKYQKLRDLSERAEVTDISTDHGINITYTMDGRTESVHLFAERIR